MLSFFWGNRRDALQHVSMAAISEKSTLFSQCLAEFIIFARFFPTAVWLRMGNDRLTDIKEL